MAHEFAKELDAFLETHGLSDTSAGLLATGDGHLVKRIRAGRARRSTVLRVRRWMQDYSRTSAASS